MKAVDQDRTPPLPVTPREHLLVLCAYLVVSLGVTYPLVLHLNTALLGDGDAWLFVWNFWWWRFALGNGLHPFCTDYIHYPTGICAYLHTWNFANTWATLPLQWILSITTLYNLCSLATFILAAWGMFRLARYLGIGSPGAFLAGLAFSFNAYHLGEANGHLNLMTYQWIPFFLQALLAGLDQWTPRRVVNATVWLTLVALSDWYHLLFCILGTAVLVFTRLTVERRRMLTVAGGAILVGILTSLLLLPVITGMLREARSVPQEHVAAAFSPDLLSFVLPPPTTSYSQWWRSIGDSWSTFTSEASTPWSVLLLAPFGLVMLRGWSRRWIPVWILIFFALSLGPVLHVAGRTVDGILLPYGWLEKIPGFYLARTPIRLHVMTWVGLSLLYGWAAVRIFGKRGAWGKTALLAALFLLETLSVPVGLSGLDISPFYSRLRYRPGQVALIDLHYNSRALFYQTVHQQKLMGLPSIVSRQTFEALRFLHETPGIHQLIEENQLAFFVNASPGEAIRRASPFLSNRSSLIFAGYSRSSGRIQVATAAPHRLQVQDRFFGGSRETVATISKGDLFVIRLDLNAGEVRNAETAVAISINGNEIGTGTNTVVDPILPTVRIPLQKTGATCLVYPNAAVESSAAAEDLARIKKEGFAWIIVPFYGNDHYVRAMGLEPVYRDRWLAAFEVK